jgi:hypothetical protein
MQDFCYRDLAVIRLKYHMAGSVKGLVLASAYLPYDSPNPPPSEELEQLERFCGYLNLQIEPSSSRYACRVCLQAANA